MRSSHNPIDGQGKQYAKLILAVLSTLAVALCIFGLLKKIRGMPFAWMTDHKNPNGDSWIILRNTLQRLHENGPDGLYDLTLAGADKFQYPPSSLLPFHFLELIGFQPSNAVLNLGSAVATFLNVVVVYFIYRAAEQKFRIGEQQRTIADNSQFLALSFVALAILFYPLNRAYMLGQVQTVINLLTALALLAWLHDRTAIAGALIGAVCLLKPQYSMFAIWGLLRRDHSFLAAFVAVTAIVGAVSLLVYGWQIHVGYLKLLSELSRLGESYYPNQSVNGLVHRWLYNGSNLDFSPHDYAPYHVTVHAATLVSGILIIGCALLFRGDDSEEGRALDILTAIVSFTVGSPIAWEHHYGVLAAVFPVLFLSLCRATPNSTRALALAVFAGSVFLTGLYLPMVERFAETPLNFLQSPILFGALTLLGLLYWRRHVLRVSTSTRASAFS